MICPYCQSRSVVKRGSRRLLFETVQSYHCKTCNRRFQDKKLKHKSYAPRVIYEALLLYYQGHTLDETRKQLNKRFKKKLVVSTVHSWINSYQSLCPIASIRKQYVNGSPLLFRKRFEHENLDYEYRVHQYKLETMLKPLSMGLYQYLRRFEQGCPQEFFEVGRRCSQPLFSIPVGTQFKRSRNLACDLARFSVQAVRTNHQRHDAVEEFMLACDLATIACEVPVWYWEKQCDDGVTGHIDILQVRNDLVYILDYKPGAARDKKAAGQLFHYAIALSFRSGVALDQIRCAWFDEKDYFEFAPANIKPRLKAVY